ncbi:hypothetical protein, partial [Escherichia coli]|uniref:hypothetical protein n=1 Tax=Escherichia coli TaxID=562 RepID=UPI00234CBAE8
DGDGSHGSTSKTPSYTKSVSWHHYPIIHKIPEFVGGTADFRRRSFSFERKRKKKIIFLPPFII